MNITLTTTKARTLLTELRALDDEGELHGQLEALADTLARKVEEERRQAGDELLKTLARYGIIQRSQQMVDVTTNPEFGGDGHREFIPGLLDLRLALAEPIPLTGAQQDLLNELRAA